LNWPLAYFAFLPEKLSVSFLLAPHGDDKPEEPHERKHEPPAVEGVADVWKSKHIQRARSPQRPGAMARDPGLRASRRLIRPFPFSNPVSAASPFTLEFRHSSPALWTD